MPAREARGERARVAEGPAIDLVIGRLYEPAAPDAFLREAIYDEPISVLARAGHPLLAVAKGPDRDAGRETLFMPGREAIKLEPRDPVLYFIQRLRDEAHRFVIGSHRKLRKKDIREAGLQEIPGIGPSRKRALLHHFGTLKEIERASIVDLGKVPGVSAESARRIFDFFHPRPG